MQRPSFLLLLLLLLSAATVSVAATATANPFTPRASFLRYWAQKVHNKLPLPVFLLSKLSPLAPHTSALLQSLADRNALSTKLPSFCAWANLFCFSTESSPSLAKHNGYSSFSSYANRNFTNYGTRALGDGNSFKNYSGGENVAADSFKRYSRESLGHDESFQNYGPDVNVLSEKFSSYSVSGLGNTGEFLNYARNVNNPNLGFNAYDTDGASRGRNFASYFEEGNAGDQSFSSYGRKTTGTPTAFAGYGTDTNVVGSTFSGYGESAVAANDTFASYGVNGNVPVNTFKSYGDGGNFDAQSFHTYREQANVGDDSFSSYAKNSNFGNATFANYGNSANPGSDAFMQYGKGANNESIGFKTYAGDNTTFKEYARKKAVSFAQYKTQTGRGISSNRWAAVEEGKFFRESKLKQGTVMKMPDIADKMPPRSFLPRSLAKKLPFSTAQMGELLRIFDSDENSTLASIAGKTLKECEREPSRGETKRCVASAEDMVDFAVQILGNDVTAKSTESLGGSKGKVEIGRVVGLNGGKVTKSVSCHQSLFPYLVYFCHSVPAVRVYEAEILDVERKEKINKGVAICHVDTSAWGPGHGAFVALGGGPGKIEVCHWIFQNDMTWVVADHY